MQSQPIPDEKELTEQAEAAGLRNELRELRAAKVEQMMAAMDDNDVLRAFGYRRQIKDLDRKISTL